jgi:two-component system sensor histidine kinase DesK
LSGINLARRRALDANGAIPKWKPLQASAADMMNSGSVNLTEENRLRIELRRANAELEEAAASQRQIDRAMILTMDSERHRISRLLHDTACQSLNGIGLLAQVIMRKLDRVGVVDAAEIAELNQAIKGAAREIYWVAREIRPPAEIDEIATALARAVESVAPTLLCEIECASEVSIECQFTAEQLVQIAHEAVSSAARRQGVTHIRVELSIHGRELTLTVWDDGRDDPAEPAATPAGLERMDLMQLRARVIGASLDSAYQENTGTTLTCLLPQHN